MGWKDYEGKKVYVSLDKNRQYQGVVQEVIFMGHGEDDVEIYVLLLKDKYGALVSFTNKEIDLIQEEK